MTDNAKIREQLEAKSFVATVFESVSHAVDYRVVRLSDAIALLDAERPSAAILRKHDEAEAGGELER